MAIANGVAIRTSMSKSRRRSHLRLKLAAGLWMGALVVAMLQAGSRGMPDQTTATRSTVASRSRASTAVSGAAWFEARR
jgi:hypothetical protein